MTPIKPSESTASEKRPVPQATATENSKKARTGGPTQSSATAASPHPQTGKDSPLFYVPASSGLKTQAMLPPLQPGYQRLFFTEHPEAVQTTPGGKAWERRPSIHEDISMAAYDGTYFKTKDQTKVGNN